MRQNTTTPRRCAVKPDDHAIEAVDMPLQARLHRLRALDLYWRKLMRVIEERAADPCLACVPGGETGLLIRRLKLIDGVVVAEFGIDTELLDLLLALEEQTALEMREADDIRRLSVSSERRLIVNILPCESLGSRSTGEKVCVIGCRFSQRCVTPIHAQAA